MKPYRLSDQAKADLRSIWRYLALSQNAPSAADRQLESLYDKFRLLSSQPLLGQTRDDLRPGLRWFTADPYVIVYYCAPKRIDIAGVIHGAQDFEAMFRGGQR